MSPCERRAAHRTGAREPRPHRRARANLQARPAADLSLCVLAAAPPGGWSTYFGFVPYAKGDFETQALQRLYPQLNYPPSMRAWTPQSGF